MPTLNPADPRSTDPDSGPVELAQAQAPGAASGEAIGQVSAVEGSVTVTHPDGTKVTATAGTPIFQGDLIETAADGAIGITFADDSTFSLADNGSMTIDEMIYDPASQTGKSAISVAEGVFTFVSGQIAKTEVDAMLIKTPVAVIGIRGTAGGGKAGPEGTPNTYSIFFDSKAGNVGEMTIKSLGGVGGDVVLNKPLQTTQMSSGFVPPIKPVFLPPQVAQTFYAKATNTAPTKPVIAPGGPTGDQGGPTGGPQQTDTVGDPQQAGPTADAPPEAVEAAAQAFEAALAAGGNIDAALAQAVNLVAAEGVKAALNTDPLAFGSAQSGDAIMNAIVDQVALSVTGKIDVLGAGTGGGNLGNFVASTVQTGLQSVFAPSLAPPPVFGPGFGDPFGGGFGDPFGGGFGFGDPFGFGGGFGFDDPFAFGFDDPFGIDFFGFGDVFFGEAGEFFFLESGDIFLFGDDDVTFIGPVETTIFDEVLFGSAGNDALVGTALNTNFFMGQNFSQVLGVEISFLGGIDTVSGGGGINQLTFDDLDSVTFTLTTDQFIFNSGVISYTGTANGSITYTDVQQFLFADVPNSLTGGFVSGSDTSAGDSGDTIVFPGLELNETGVALVGGSGNDTPFVIDTAGLDGFLVFAKGGPDTIDIRVATDGLAIGGITSNDNVDSNADGIADSAINVFDYTNVPLPGGATGLLVNLVGTDFVDTVNNANFGGDGLVRDNGSVSEINNNLLDVGHFIASGGDDTINVLAGPSGGGFSVIDGGDGNDKIEVSGNAKIGSILGGLGNDTIGGGDILDTIFGGSGDDIIFGHGGGDLLSGDAGIDRFVYDKSDLPTAGQASIAYDQLTDFVAAASGDLVVWDDTAGLNNGATTVSLGEFTSSGFLGDAAIAGGVITGNSGVVIFEFANTTTLGIDIVLGTTTSAQIESAAASVLSSVTHATGDNLLFALYDNAGTTQSVAFLKFTGDSTTTGIAASELQVMAVADVTANALVDTNFDVASLDSPPN